MVSSKQIDEIRQRLGAVNNDIQVLFEAIEERDTLIADIVQAAHEAEDAEDFILWIIDELTPISKSDSQSAVETHAMGAIPCGHESASGLPSFRKKI